MQTTGIQRCTALRERETGREFVVTDVQPDVVFYRACVGKIVGEIMSAYLDEVFEVMSSIQRGVNA